MKKVGLVILIGIVLMSSFAFGLKSFNPAAGTTLTLDNDVCEMISLEFSEGDSKTFTLEEESFTVKFLGIKEINHNQDDGDISGIPFMKAGDKRSSEDSYVEVIFEHKGVEYRYFNDIFQNKLGNLYLDAWAEPNLETDWDGDVYEETYLGGVTLGIYERGKTTDCEGFDDTNEWRGSYIDAIQFHKGWNLVPRDTRVDECYGQAASQICYNDFLDKPITYILEPVEKKYYTEEWIEEYAESKGNDYWNKHEEELQQKISAGLEERGLDEEAFYGEELSTSLDFIIDILKEGELLMSFFEFEDFYEGAQWVYINDNLAGKYQMKYSYSSMDSSFGIVLFEGWNLQYVYSDYIFSDNNNILSRSLNDLKGTCEIEGAFFFDASTQEWKTLGLDYEFVEDDLNKGFAIKVKGDCRIGKLRANQGLPPAAPAS